VKEAYVEGGAMTKFVRFVASAAAVNLADGVALVAWGWMASLLTRDALLVALLPLALRLPWFLLSVPAGIVIDRVDRLRLILWMDGLRAIVFALVALAVWLALPLDVPEQGVASAPLYAALVMAALLVGGAEVFRDNAGQTLLPSLVPKERLEAANGRLWSVELVGNALAGPALGAVLIAAFVPLPFALNAACYAVAVAMVLNLPRHRLVRQAGNWRAELAEGFRHLRASPLLRVLALLTGLWNLLFQMAFVALILHVQENLHLGAQVYGLILAAAAVGGILGGLVGERVIARLGPLRTAQVMLASAAPAFLAMAFAPGAISLGLAMMIFEFSGLIWNTVAVSHRQRSTPDAILGRVNSLYRLVATGMMPLGSLLSGLVVLWSEPTLGRSEALRAPFLAAALLGVVLSLWGWRLLARGFAAKDAGAT
jgi:MFS family permease